MFDHLSFGVSNFDQSLAFYDAVLKPLGISRMFAMAAQGIAGFSGEGGTTFWLYANDQAQNPLGAIASPPRMHLAFKAKDAAAVDAFYAAAMDQGGSDEGAPGIRSQYHPKYYAAYVRDPNGYKLEAVCHNG